MVSEDSNIIESILGHERAEELARLDDSESKRIIETILVYVKQTFYDIDKHFSLVVGHSKDEIERFQKLLEQLDLEKLKITLDLDGFSNVPNDWLALARFLLKAERGKSYECARYLSNLARMIIFKISGYGNDKEFLRTFHKVPVGQLLRFFKKYRIEKTTADGKESSHG